MLKRQSAALSAMFAYQQLHHQFDCDEQRFKQAAYNSTDCCRDTPSQWQGGVSASLQQYHTHFNANVSTRVTRVS